MTANTRTGVSAPHDFGELRLHGFVSKPEIQKLNRNSIFIFVNGRLIRDRLIQHAITEAYRNILPPTVFPVVLLFIEMPTAEVDVNVHPSKTEVRFRQQTVIHDFVRESVRAALMKARPVPQFLTEIGAQPSAGRGLSSPGLSNPHFAGGEHGAEGLRSAPWRDLYGRPTGGFALQAPALPATTARLEFEGGIAVEGNAAVSLARAPAMIAQDAIADQPITDQALANQALANQPIPDHGCAPPIAQEPQPRRHSSRCEPCGLWARFGIPLFLPSTKTGCGSSINMWRTNACFSSESCANARRSGWRASVCSCL